MSQSPMDPFDEFEFKPLTDGLGFHKKQVTLQEGLKSTGVLEDALQSIPLEMPKALIDDEKPRTPQKKHTFEDVLSALEKSPLKTPSVVAAGQAALKAAADLQFTEVLPREPKKGSPMSAMEIETPRPVQSPFPRPEAYRTPINQQVPISPSALKKTPAQSDLANVGTRRGAADSPQRKLLPATISFESALLDFIIVMGLSLVFMVALLLVTKVDLNIVMKNVSADLMTQLSMAVLFISVMQMYVVIARSFFGRTLGEWTFDLQLGQDNEHVEGTYPLKVAFRSLLNTITGLVFLPLVSTVLGRDIAGQITGLQLYKQRV